MQRIEHYQKAYQSLDEKLESAYSFMKIFNAGEKVLVHRHEGKNVLQNFMILDSEIFVRIAIFVYNPVTAINT